MDDRELVSSLLRGEPGSADTFVEAFQGPLWRMLVGQMRLPDHLAADVLQDVLLKIWSNDLELLRNWRGDSTLLTYLLVIVRRAALDALRARARQDERTTTLETGQGEVDYRADGPDPEDDALAAERRACLAAARERLGENDQRLIALRHDEGLLYAEIAQTMGRTVNHVGVGLGRAEQRLAVILEELYPGLFERRRGRDRV